MGSSAWLRYSSGSGSSPSHSRSGGTPGKSVAPPKTISSALMPSPTALSSSATVTLLAAMVGVS